LQPTNQLTYDVGPEGVVQLRAHHDQVVVVLDQDR
jgi:hypothetical protein